MIENQVKPELDRSVFFPFLKPHDRRVTKEFLDLYKDTSLPTAYEANRSRFNTLLQVGRMFSEGGDGFEGSAIAMAVEGDSDDIEFHQTTPSYRHQMSTIELYIKNPNNSLLPEINTYSGEVFHAVAVKILADVAEDRNSHPPQELELLAELIKFCIQFVFDEPAYRYKQKVPAIHILNTLNAVVDALRDCALYLKDSKKFSKVNKVVRDHTRIPLAIRYNAQLATTFVTHQLKTAKIPLPQNVHIEGSFKSISSLLLATQWKFGEKQSLVELSKGLHFVDDKIRARIWFESMDSFNATVLALQNKVNHPPSVTSIVDLINRLLRHYVIPQSIHIFQAKYINGEIIERCTTPVGQNPAGEVKRRLIDQCALGVPTYCGIHAIIQTKTDSQNVPIEIQCRLGTTFLKALFRLCSTINRNNNGEVLDFSPELQKKLNQLMNDAQKELVAMRPTED